MAGSLVQDLRELVARRRVLVIVGAGVSIGATRNAGAASWAGLLKLGAARCRELNPSLDEAWEKRLIAEVESDDLDDTLSAAEKVSRKLGAPNGGEFSRWLRETIGALPVRELAVLEALRDLRVPLATTNYDNLLERVTKLPAVNWRDQTRVFEVLRGEQQAILHLHGCWADPQSVVLGIRSYKDVQQDPHAHAVIRALAMTQSLLFVGCGEGLADPNFKPFLSWLAEVNASNQARHYRLALAHDVLALQKDQPPTSRVFVVSYGTKHDDLAAFLRSLAPQPHQPAASKVRRKPGTRAPGRGPSGPKPLTPASATDSPAILEYLRRLEAATAKLQLIGLGQGVQIELPIERAYIPLHVAISRELQRECPGHFPGDKAARERGPVEEDVHLCDIFRWAGRFESRGVLLLGDPGAGKTTGARQFCWRLLNERGSAPFVVPASAGSDTPMPPEGGTANLGLPPGAIPVFLRLRHLTPHHLSQGANALRAFITDSVAAPSLPDDLANPGPDLLARKGVLWVFDGLDEVVNENARVLVCRGITQMLEQRPDDCFLVTSRYQGYQGRVDLGPAFCQFHVKPLNESQVAAFVDHWYRTVFQRLHGQPLRPASAPRSPEAFGVPASAGGGQTTRPALAPPDRLKAGLQTGAVRGLDPDLTQQAEKEIASLMKMLGEPEYRIGRLRELPANPLMLTILCVVHHQDRNLPRRRADLYARCVRVLVEHWRKGLWEDQGLTGYDPEAAEAVLATVAWWLHEQEGRTTHTVEALAAVAAKALADLAPGAGLGRDGEAFIRRMRDESGILAMWSAGQCGFLHLTFQEYLAGLHAAREGKAGELVRHVGKSWWREVILVAAAIGSKDFATRFFTALVAGDAVGKEGAFVDQCLDEARYAVLEPFLAALTAKGAKPERQLDLLRRLKPFARPEAAELITACRELAGSRHAELASLARELLQRAGLTVEQPALEVGGAPLEQWVDLKTGIAFITIPAGEFDMGSNEFSSTKPIHRVRITKPFRLGKYPVTNAEYERFLQANSKVQPPEYWTNSQFNDPQQPVVGVSWHDAQTFCRWAGCRLPTEAEWEYACRAGSTGRFCFGDDETKLGEYAWYDVNSGRRTHPVGQKKPNAWGLYEVHGNVWEWCEDWFGTYPKGPVADPTGPSKGTSRVLRGGSWNNDNPALLSCASRDIAHPKGRFGRGGFRCVWGGVGSAPG